MKMPSAEDRRPLYAALILIVSLGIAALALGLTGYLDPLIGALWEAFQGKEQMRAFLESWGPWAPAAFMGIQILQVVLAPIPGEFTGAVGGFLFGAAATTVYSTIALTIGSLIAFIAARIIGLPLVKLVASDKTLNKFQFLTKPRGTMLILALFVLPGFPKDILSYMLGLSPIGFWRFLIVCGIGRIPGTAMLSITGAAVYDENWTMLAAMTVACIIAMAVFYFFWSKMETRLEKEHEDTSQSGAVSG